MLRLPGRYYRTLPIDAMQYETEELELDPARTTLVVMHCWNIGCEDGPPADPSFWVGMGSREALAEAERILREVIRPCMDAARKAGVLVSHVESEGIAAKHAEAQEDTDPLQQPPHTPPPPPAVPGWREQIVVRSHGKDYATKSPYAHMDRAKVVEPMPGEPFVYQTAQLDRMLRRRGIENLIYTGFATDMCVLRAPGGIEPMSPYGYRLFLVRNATLGVELPDTFDERIATRWGIRYFETHFGDTVLSTDFIEACDTLA